MQIPELLDLTASVITICGFGYVLLCIATKRRPPAVETKASTSEVDDTHEKILQRRAYYLLLAVSFFGLHVALFSIVAVIITKTKGEDVPLIGNIAAAAASIVAAVCIGCAILAKPVGYAESGLSLEQKKKVFTTCLVALIVGLVVAGASALFVLAQLGLGKPANLLVTVFTCVFVVLPSTLGLIWSRSVA